MYYNTEDMHHYTVKRMCNVRTLPANMMLLSETQALFYLRMKTGLLNKRSYGVVLHGKISVFSVASQHAIN